MLSFRTLSWNCYQLKIRSWHLADDFLATQPQPDRRTRWSKTLNSRCWRSTNENQRTRLGVERSLRSIFIASNNILHRYGSVKHAAPGSLQDWLSKMESLPPLRTICLTRWYSTKCEPDLASHLVLTRRLCPFLGFSELLCFFGSFCVRVICLATSCTGLRAPWAKKSQVAEAAIAGKKICNGPKESTIFSIICNWKHISLWLHGLQKIDIFETRTCFFTTPEFSILLLFPVCLFRLDDVFTLGESLTVKHWVDIDKWARIALSVVSLMRTDRLQT